MYFCPNCNGEDFVYKLNKFGEEVEECTICGEQYPIDEEDDEEDDDEW